MHTHYVALLSPTDGQSYAVRFPDFPDCAAEGGSLQEAMAEARRVLAGHVEALSEAGAVIPKPTPMERVLMINGSETLAFTVGVAIAPNKAVPISISLPKDVLVRVDRYVANRRMNRSAFFHMAAQQLLEER